MSKRVCLITGASSGIGEVMARQLVQGGWRVVGVARNNEKLQGLGAELGKDFTPMVCDVSNGSDVKNTSDQLKEKDIIPTYFFLNAGYGENEGDGLSANVHEKVMKTNYFGVVNWLEHWLKYSLDRNSQATFIATSSMAALYPLPYNAAYSASKGALTACFDSLRIQHVDNNVKFVTVMPGGIKTNILKNLNKSIAKANNMLSWFVLKKEDAAKRILDGVLKGKKEIIILPTSLLCLGRIMSLLPTKSSTRVSAWIHGNKTKQQAIIGLFAGGSVAALGATIAVTLFITGVVAAELISIAIAVVATTIAALAVGGITYMLSKPSTKIDEPREEQSITGNWKA
ncbi:SDR family NAD(P)-dependent oxidoreductase [Wolbachia endosymbiont (group A) of Lasioglossum morio]|uniref:SDR family NAD(P)-dependent oxidoreductase n=1 Tax=Wolbachia endosymbiont (group A) of Lasioglossum morio TaxID=2954025 RepID=UPI002227342E|nr:SDR family NAD(P)-dependent oxidoreductase [Wolbachia endosymbiont (group A) of Lasioglossum morio]